MVRKMDIVAALISSLRLRAGGNLLSAGCAECSFMYLCRCIAFASLSGVPSGVDLLESTGMSTSANEEFLLEVGTDVLPLRAQGGSFTDRCCCLVFLKTFPSIGHWLLGVLASERYGGLTSFEELVLLFRRWQRSRPRGAAGP